MTGQYDFRNCQSLFGYAEAVHRRSGGICQLCGCGGGHDVDFDLWRQMTVEHIIGSSQGGYFHQIKEAVAKRFPELSDGEQDSLSRRIDEANTKTACHFCNSTTSRAHHHRSMGELIAGATGTPEELVASVTRELTAIFEKKRETAQWKVGSVKSAFEAQVKPELLKASGRKDGST